MWNWDYEEEGTNIRDGVRGTVTGGCSKGIFLALEDGQEAFAHFGGLNPGTTVLCTVLSLRNFCIRLLSSILCRW